ncbi:MAG: hypothetical protein JWL76_1199 [Thermoleophilia bacterium]|nr:hypothetical protein [Thermoleophilia bacterium]
MIDRGTVLRGFFALFLIAVIGSVGYMFLSNTDGSSGNFLEDGDDRTNYGPIFEDPDAYRKATITDPFIRDMHVTGGTFGSTITRQVRIDIDGSGPIPSRDVTLQTKPAVRLFNGPRRERALDVLHGVQRILEDEGALLEGISIARTRGGVEAAAISGIIEEFPTDGYYNTPAEKKMVTDVLSAVAADLAGGAYAWYDPRIQQIVFGPVISKGLHTWIETPKRATAAENLFTAYVVRHELEHAVTPGDGDSSTYRWLEEGTADTIARWPGVAADTAKQLGMTYPKRYEKIEYRTDRGGYPEYVDSLRILLGAAGVSWKDPTQLEEAKDVLQARELRDVPAELATRIAKAHRLSAAQRIRLERGIRRMDGTPSEARRLVGKL